MNHFLTAALLVLIFTLPTGCSQKKVATIDPTSPQGGTQTADAQPLKQVPVEPVTSLDKDPQESIPAYVKELQSKLQDIRFAFDRYDLSDEAKSSVKNLADIMTKNKKIAVTIEGHCDERGTNEYNLALGDRRAKAAKEYLAALGIASGRIEVISYGEEKPVCAESTEACWAKNRRDHFTLAGEKR
ncbi:MAG: peptidoglycan-associated lipoprotein Pal [Thermodesulfovibrionales bacterium]